MRSRLDQGEMVLLSPLGYSPTGEIFNLTLENIATTTAIALGAEKLIFLTDTAGIQENAENKSDTLLRELTVNEGKVLVEKSAMSQIKLADDIQLYLPCAIKACQEGVARVHLISRHVDGAMLQELFTHDGIGSMISQGSLRTLRGAKIEDVGSILQMIEPLEAKGLLVHRNRELLELEIDYFVVLEHDGLIIGCAALHPFPKKRPANLLV